MKRVKISVTAADISEGKQMMCQRFPVALALRRAFDAKYGDDVGVLQSFARVRSISYELPLEVTKFIQRFDGGFAVQPFDFYLAVA